MTKENAISLVNEILGEGKYLNPREIFFEENLDVNNYSIGKHELGEGKWISKHEYINCNERCDTKLVLIKNHPEVEAISSAHYHRQGWVGSLNIWIKNKNNMIKENAISMAVAMGFKLDFDQWDVEDKGWIRFVLSNDYLDEKNFRLIWYKKDSLEQNLNILFKAGQKAKTQQINEYISL